MERKQRKMNAARVLFGISRIGYTPASAICDIMDNSVSAGAKNIHIMIKTKHKNVNRKNNIEEYLIVDDGAGMNLEQLENALDLGSNDYNYAEGSLSKFGLGLKSASFAQGNKLTVVSGDGTEIHKEYVDLDEIEDEYFSIEEDLSGDEKELVQKYFKDGKRGTIVRITKIHQNNHPSLRKIIDELEMKVGVIYYYFLKEGLHIYLQDKEINPFDPLFVDEAGENNLNEHEWDGKTVQWLSRTGEYMLDASSGVKATIEMTMLPHPQVFKSDDIPAETIRDKYKINSQNYGFYIYRNKRLINWANSLNNIIPRDQDFYAFRGRILIESNADDAFNIDVSKSNIFLSEDANAFLNDHISQYKSKCKKAWNNAFKKFNALTSLDSKEETNSILNGVDDGELDSGVPEDSEEFENEKEKRERKIIEDQKNKSEKETIEHIKDKDDIEKAPSELTPEDIDETMKGSSKVNSIDKVFRVPNIMDNILWEPYVDAEEKECVRISLGHRFSKLVYEENSNNKALQILFDLLLFVEAKSELDVIKKYHAYDSEEIENILSEFRLSLSEKLTKLCRMKDSELPHDKES